MPPNAGGSAAIDIDVAGIRGAAGPMGPAASAIPEHGAATVRTWREAEPFYLAPEAGQFLGALDPLNRLTTLAGERVGLLGRALGAYADSAEPLIAQIRRLQAATGGPPDAQAEREQRLAALMAELLAVEQACAAAISALSAPDVRPERIRTGEQATVNGGVVSVGFLSVGQNGGFRMTTFSDGTVHLTAVDGGGIGASLEAGSVVELGAGVNFEVGSTWRFRDLGEAERFRVDIEEYVAQERAVLYEPGADQGVAIFGGVARPRDPDLMVSQFAVPVTGAGTVDLGRGGASIAGGGELTLTGTVARDAVSGATITTTNRELSGTLGAELALGRGRAGSDGTVVTGSGTTVVRDANGQITRIVLSTTERHEHGEALGGAAAHGEAPPDPDGGRHRAPDDLATAGYTDRTTQADLTVTTTAVDIRPADRALAEEFVAAEANDAYGALDDGATYHPDRAVAGDRFQNLAHSRGVVTAVDYREVTRSRGGEVGVNLGPEAGVEFSHDETRTQAVEARYLDRPDAAGLRNPVPLALPD